MDFSDFIKTFALAVALGLGSIAFQKLLGLDEYGNAAWNGQLAVGICHSKGLSLLLSAV